MVTSSLAVESVPGTGGMRQRARAAGRAGAPRPGRGGGAGSGRGAAAGEDVEAEVAAAFGPFVVLLGEHGADQADQGVAVGEDADDGGAPTGLRGGPCAGG